MKGLIVFSLLPISHRPAFTHVIRPSYQALTFKDKQAVLDVQEGFSGLGVPPAEAGACAILHVDACHLPQLPIIFVLAVYAALPMREHPLSARWQGALLPVLLILCILRPKKCRMNAVDIMACLPPKWWWTCMYVQQSITD